jgi:hypothetical protein
MREPLGGHSDAAKRASDQWKLHRVALGLGAIGQWFAVRLSDGTGDGTLYPSKYEAVRHQHHNEMYYAFLCIAPTDLGVCDADVYIKTARALYDVGVRMHAPDDPAGGRSTIMRATREDQLSLTRSIARRGRTVPGNLVMPSRPH